MNEPVQLRAWAERVLFGSTLRDKLWEPNAFRDDRPGPAIESPPRPGRPRGLEISSAEGPAPPGEHALDDPRSRGSLLHRFANHELLALELMALALLRFPHAPSAFRRGLAQTLAEEQRHLRLYLDRMQTLGVELGEQPSSGFFWRVMAPMPSPLDFVAHMALTFEQANLDFALHYATTLRRVGDERSAAILDEVRADEIGHVKLGLVWFERWRERGPSLFEAHRRALRPPMTPRRARGLDFDREGRTLAGFGNDYMERLELFEASRGRPPVVHWFEPTAELQLGTGGAYTPSAATQAMTEDLELLPALAAAREDRVLLRRAPGVAHLRTLAEAGLVMPECIEVDEHARELRTDSFPSKLAELRPWGWAPRARRWLAPLVEHVERPPPPAESDAILHAKTTWAELREELWREFGEPWLDSADTLGVIAREPTEVWAACEEIQARGYSLVVIKAPFGSSGRNAQRITAEGPTVAQRGWVERTLAVQKAVLLEPWLDRICDISLRLTVDPEGKVRIDDLGRFLTDRRGQYLGAVLGPLSRAVPPRVARMLHGDGDDPKRLDRVMKRVAASVAEVVHRYGYAGPVGVDGLVYRDLEGVLRLRPLIEVNVRPNLGHVVHGLYRRLARGSAGLFVVFRLADLPPGIDLSEALAIARRALPVETTGQPLRLRSGAVPATDPTHARLVAALLLVARTRAEALHALATAAPAVAKRVSDALG